MTRDPNAQYLRAVTLLRDRVTEWDVYPWCVPAISHLHTLPLHPSVTFFVGENGSGKSTLLEAIASLVGFGHLGGTKDYNLGEPEHILHETMRLVRGTRRERDGFFLRAETYYVAGKFIDAVANVERYGGKVHEQSHGEAFLSLMKNRFRGNGLYILDEPEAALSPMRQLSFLALLDDLARQRGAQFIIATHSPIIMAYPDATLYACSETGIAAVSYKDTEHYQVTSGFLANPESYLRHIVQR